MLGPVKCCFGVWGCLEDGHMKIGWNAMECDMWDAGTFSLVRCNVIDRLTGVFNKATAGCQLPAVYLLVNYDGWLHTVL